MDLKTFCSILGIILFVPILGAASVVPEDLLIITEEYEPMNYVENGILKGISVDILEEMLFRAGSGMNRSSFQVVPWNEGYNLTLHTPDTLLFSTGRYPEREELFRWIGPLMKDREVLFMRSDRNSSEMPDIGLASVAAVKSDIGIDAAISAGASRNRIIEVDNPRDAVVLVENGTADYFSYSEMPGRRAINQSGFDESRFVVGRDLGEEEYYIACNPQTPPEFVSAMNAILKELKLDRSQNGVTRYEEILARYLPAGCVDASAGREAVMALVSETAADISRDTQETLAAINAGKSPYLDSVDPNLYVFVYGTDVTLLADAPNPGNVGRSYAGKTDIFGKPFRDEIVSGAMQNGTGWVSYVLSNPGALGIYYKETYYNLTAGSDGKEYVVAAGRYLTCEEMSSAPSS